MTFHDTPDRIAFCGDWHANLRYAQSVIRRLADNGVTHIVHTGDFGWLFQTSFIADLETALNTAGIYLGFVDGNHEDFNYLNNLDDPRITPHIRHIRRGERWEWSGVSFLGLGGAHSVDRPHRKPNVSWWAAETLGHIDVERAIEGGRADVMVCHDVPAGVRVPGIEGSPFGFHPHELRLADQHRDVLRVVVDEVQPARLFHGHYHVRYTDVLRGDGYVTVVDGLAHDGEPLMANVALADLASLSRADSV
ncbi:metallophosphoesterase [Rhodococcus ruber]|uniref:metallophosphoesterase family protein n=1 Tax=Rhodococcus ruber TaxID=1830 RepID=UPI0022B357BE|nr:metallophosphoesterase [Rhodococcus ruber]MCZ4506386.1 metallophosphoesterase [Rhodococcus ruber]